MKGVDLYSTESLNSFDFFDESVAIQISSWNNLYGSRNTVLTFLAKNMEQSLQL